jgi:hypothetical protein
VGIGGFCTIERIVNGDLRKIAETMKLLVQNRYQLGNVLF